MTRIEHLKVAKPCTACQACKTFEAEVLAPVGDGAARLCWLCAHHVAEHDASLQAAPSAECECTPDQVYPADVRARCTSGAA